MNGLDVSISVNSNQKTFDGSIERNDYLYTGKLYQKGNEYYLRYREFEELGNTWAIIKWNTEAKAVSIIRQGDVKAEQLFKQDFTHQTTYRSPHGTFVFDISTAQLNIELLNEKEGRIYIEYKIDSSGQHIAEHKIEINFKSTKDETE